MLGDQDGAVTTVIVIDGTETVDHRVKDHEVGPDCHGAGEGNLNPLFSGDRGDKRLDIATDHVDRLRHRSGEVEPSSDLLDSKAIVERGVAEAEVDGDHGSGKKNYAKHITLFYFCQEFLCILYIFYFKNIFLLALILIFIVFMFCYIL